jgi:glycerol-3-phosphate acyltransferase PlsX
VAQTGAAVTEPDHVMAASVTIAIDAMGGDHGPSIVVPGADIAAGRFPAARFILVGDETRIRAELANLPRLAERATVIHTDVSVRMDDKPSQALRAGRYKSSMWVAIEQVKTGAAQVAVSAGNTGALMAMAKFCLKTVPGVDRPAIAAIWPTLRGESIVLDVGASIGADKNELVTMAVLGAAMSRCMKGLERPNLALLNIGVEEVKGVEEVREAGQILRELNLPGMNYIGFVEGDDLGQGMVDVVVTEGFAGNIALKTAEGTAKQIGTWLKDALSSSMMSKIGTVFAAGAFRALKSKLDPRNSNGGVFLGLNGVVIKSHGGTDALGFASAVDVAHAMVSADLIARIAQDLATTGAMRSSQGTSET